ncbi:hypothetical protein C8R47DRAFT_1076597 [Mycena vitilis]|nr:hypothetical protein C8R47DRAFT_1076597 [Mycena vitilis]
MRDGAPIRRQGSESLVQAAERQGRPISTDLEEQVMGFYWNSNVRQEDLDSDLRQDLEYSDNDIGTEEEEYELLESDNEGEEVPPLVRAEIVNLSDSQYEDTEEEPDINTDMGEDDTAYNTFQKNLLKYMKQSGLYLLHELLEKLRLRGCLCRLEKDQ